MTDKEPAVVNATEVKTEFLGTIEGEVGRRSVFLSLHFDKEGRQIYSRASLLPQVTPLVELAEQEMPDTPRSS